MDRQTRLARIYETIRDIPRGSVASYGQIAEIAGIPRGARQVGWALKRLPRGQTGSTRFEKQKKLLVEENIAVIAGRVDMRKYRWQPQLDELLWKPTSAWDEC